MPSFWEYESSTYHIIMIRFTPHGQLVLRPPVFYLQEWFVSHRIPLEGRDAVRSVVPVVLTVGHRSFDHGGNPNEETGCGS